MSENRIQQVTPAKSEESHVRTVPLWVKALIAGGIPALTTGATVLSPPFNLISGALAASLAGVAAWLGMTVGTPKP